MRYVVEGQSQGILNFVEVQQLLCILPNYGFIWEQLHEEQGLYDFVDARFFASINIKSNCGLIYIYVVKCHFYKWLLISSTIALLNIPMTIS